MRFCVFDARFPPLSGVFFICALLAGCAAPQSRALRSAPSPLLPSAIELDQTPFVDNQLALLGLGNTAFSLQDWQAAEAAFRNLAAMASDPVPALNNLALALDAQGQLAQALEVARRAVSLGGQFAAQSRNTLATLVEKTRDDGRNR